MNGGSLKECKSTVSKLEGSGCPLFLKSSIEKKFVNLLLYKTKTCKIVQVKLYNCLYRVIKISVR